MSSKALAGPKYVVNVRFDNAEYAQAIKTNNLKEEYYHIKPREVLVCSKTLHRKNRDRITGVQSWCPQDTSVFDEKYRFAGVAETGQAADHRHSMQQGLAMCVSGIVKAVNESRGLIRVGDFLTYGPNGGKATEDGVPKNKSRVTFIKYNSDNAIHVNRGIVARAESGARHGETFDAHVFAHTQYKSKYTVAELFVLSVPEGDWDGRDAADMLKIAHDIFKQQVADEKGTAARKAFARAKQAKELLGDDNKFIDRVGKVYGDDGKKYVYDVLNAPEPAPPPPPPAQKQRN
jgi:hypothetical protein